MRTVLGIDAGGTKTVVVLVGESGAVLNYEVFPGLDPTRTENAEAELDGFLLGLVPADTTAPEAATVGLPFHGEIDSITTMQRNGVARRLGSSARACNDVEVAHIGAFAGGDGVLVLAGTGSMAWAKGPLGTARAGGFGDLIGDEGSAFWIGRRAVALLSQEADGRRPTSAFTTGLLKSLGVPQDGLIGWVYRQQNQRSGIASVARHISALAASGNTDALSILQEAAVELAATARAAARVAGLTSPSPLSTAGGVFLDQAVRTELARLMDGEPIPGLLPPAGGAALDAARRAGWAVDQTWISKLGNELKQKGAA